MSEKIQKNISRLASKHAFTLGHLHQTGGRELECVLERYDSLAAENERLRAELSEERAMVSALNGSVHELGQKEESFRTRVAELEKALAEAEDAADVRDEPGALSLVEEINNLVEQRHHLARQNLTLRERVAKFEASQAWRPIEAAPKDRRILVRDSPGDEPYVAWWTNDAYAEDGGRGGPAGWYSWLSGGDHVRLHAPKHFFDPDGLIEPPK